MGVTDIARHHAPLPIGHFGQREKEVGLGAARAERRDTPLPGPEELARITECMSQRLVRLPDVFQVTGESVKEFQPGEFPLDRQHGAISIVLEAAEGQVLRDTSALGPPAFGPRKVAENWQRVESIARIT